MPANHKVSVGWQIVFTFLPIVNFWAFYRIRKLQKYFLYIIVPEIIVSAAYGWYYITSTDFSKWGDDGLAFGNGNSFAVWLATSAIGWALTGLTIYLVIIWSRQHNKQYERPAT